MSTRDTIRIGDAERDVAAHELGEHFVAGRLTLDELHDRLGLVLSARTRGQLTRLMADLPTPRQPIPHVPGWTGGPSWPIRQGFVERVARDQEAAPPAQETPALPASTRRERAARETASQFAAVALLLVAMLIWLLTVMLFTVHG